MERLHEPELTQACEALAAATGGALGRVRRRPEGGYDIVIVCPPGAEDGWEDRIYSGAGNTPQDAKRDLLKHHS